MNNVGVIIEIQQGRLKPSNFGVITAARQGGRKVHAFLLDVDADGYKSRLEEYGVSKIVEISTPSGPLKWNPALWARAIIGAMERFGITTVMGLSTARGKDLLPRVAAWLDAPLVMDCIRVDLDTHTARRYQYSGKTVAAFKLQGAHHLYGMRPNAMAAVPAPASAEVVGHEAQAVDEGLVVREIRREATAGADLTEADVIISGGRGMKGGENFGLLRECADLLGAAVGASRVAVDEGWVPHSMQVGQTGVTVSPKVYIACGISGSVQHFAGMKTAGLIIAVNTDAKAPITRLCDYYVVGDLFEIVPQLTAELKKLRGTS